MIAALAAILLTAGAALFGSSQSAQTETVLRIAATSVDEIRSSSLNTSSPQAREMEAWRRRLRLQLYERLYLHFFPPPPATPLPNQLLAFQQAVEYVSAKKAAEAAMPQAFIDLCGLDGAAGRALVDDAATLPPPAAASLPAPPPIASAFNDATPAFGGNVVDVLELGLGRPYCDDPPTADIVRRFCRRIHEAQRADGLPLLDMTRHTAETESSELLYIMVTSNWMGSTTVIAEDSIPSQAVGDTDGDGLPELLDSWGNPLQFYTSNACLYRPTNVVNFTLASSSSRPDAGTTTSDPGLLGRLAALSPRAAKAFRPVAGGDRTSSINRDSHDPYGIVAANGLGGSALPALSELGSVYSLSLTEIPRGASAVNQIFPPMPVGTFVRGYTGPIGTRGAPMIVSAGPDEVLGMQLPTALTGDRYGELLDPVMSGGNPAADNLTSLQIGGL